MRQFFEELKRRNVYRVAVAYAAAAFVVVQAARLLVPALLLPDWIYRAVVLAAILGFPIALVIAWAFELTPEGVRRTEDAGRSGEAESIPADERRARSRLAAKALVGLGLVGAAVAGSWYLMGGGGTTVSDRSVAVLPFETLGDTASTPFTEGLHNDLLTRLQRVSDLTVIARPSVVRYEDTDKPLSRVAEELNARWIVTAAVQQAGDRVQVNPRLIDPRTGTERWSDSYQGELSADQIFSLQQEITRSIADALEVELATGEQERLQERPTQDLDAYHLYVEGRQQFAQRSGACVSCVRDAVRLFRRAIERDSSFALAWTGLADAAALELPDSVATIAVDAETAARRALELDPDLAEAHASMGRVHLEKMNAPAALQELRRAIDLKPSYWEAHHWLGYLYLLIGRPEQALEHLELAVELNPQHALARHFLYDAYLATGQPKKSLEEARRQQRLGLEEEGAVAGEHRALYELGRYEEVGEFAEETDWEGGLALSLAARGDTARARVYLDDLRADDDYLQIGNVHSVLGEFDRALEAWRQIPKEHWGSIAVPHQLRYGVLNDLGPIRGDPGYEKLIREANRAWGLNPDGSLPDSVDASFETSTDD